MLMASMYGCFSKNDRFLVTTPLFHGGGFAFPMAALFLGGQVELMPRYQPDLLLQRMSAPENTGTFVVPTQLHSLFTLPEALLDQHRQHSLRTIICNAAPLPETTKYQTLDYFGEGVLHETYGSTEVGIATNLQPEDMRRKQNCVGKAIPGQVIKLLNDAGGEVTTGEVGDLYSDGPTLFNGYLNRPEETAECFRGSFFCAGDQARMDEEGYIYIVGRKKDMIISGGVNIYPRDIEDVLVQHPAIAEAAVIGIADEHWGEAVCAFVVRADNSLDDNTIIDYCRDHLAPQKVPKSVRFIDAIPKNITGKVLKKDLREQLS